MTNCYHLCRIRPTIRKACKRHGVRCAPQGPFFGGPLAGQGAPNTFPKTSKDNKDLKLLAHLLPFCFLGEAPADHRAFFGRALARRLKDTSFSEAVLVVLRGFVGILTRFGGSWQGEVLRNIPKKNSRSPSGTCPCPCYWTCAVTSDAPCTLEGPTIDGDALRVDLDADSLDTSQDATRRPHSFYCIVAQGDPKSLSSSTAQMPNMALTLPPPPSALYHAQSIKASEARLWCAAVACGPHTPAAWPKVALHMQSPSHRSSRSQWLAVVCVCM